MSTNQQSTALFRNGSAWIRADFHLHTHVDKEFQYSGDETAFVSSYVDALAAADIRLGIIANHNKFDVDEFKALHKKARKQEIALLPGVELSVNDGANGIHVLIVFSGTWLENGQDYISPFIATMFPGKTPDSYQHENGRSDKNILQAVEELEKVARDYFLVFAHVEEGKGLWQEMKGGKLSDWRDGRYDSVRHRTLAFQKVRTHDVPDRVCRTKVRNWLGDWYPAEVEGSDPKSLTDIGRGRECWVKLGSTGFEAVKYALLDPQNRVCEAKPDRYPHSHILSIQFEGGTLDGQTVEFSPELNTFIGIRGSGKSSVIETIRYVLDIPFGEKAMDTGYKQALVEHTLGSGGKAIITAKDRHGREYTISRILNDSPEVLVDGMTQHGLSIRETVLHKPIYFGQKDLSSTGDGFETDLVEKLVGERLTDLRRKIEEQRQAVSTAAERWLKLSTVQDQVVEWEAKLNDATYRLKIFEELGVAEKLKKQTEFDADERKLKQILSDVDAFAGSLGDVLTEHEDRLTNHRTYKPKQNPELWEAFFASLDSVLRILQMIKTAHGDAVARQKEVGANLEAFRTARKSLTEEFAETKRQLEQELRERDAQSIRIEEFPKLQKAIAASSDMLEALRKQSENRDSVRHSLLAALSVLSSYHQQEFQAIQQELEKVNETGGPLTITGEFRGDKTSLLEFMQGMFRGSNIRRTTFEGLVKAYPDFVAMFRDWENVLANAGSSPETFGQYFQRNLKELLTWRTPDRFTIQYRGKELQHHSLGQRASALILFVLSQQDHDVIVIDQPEDDLDNQTIYEEVIKLIRQLKAKTQFVFATHNANVPVLGDAEQIHACRYADGHMTLTTGSIDNPRLQREIVDIMEGGEDAFNRRKEIYEVWKPASSSR